MASRHTIDVTEAASLAFLRVVQASGPVDGNIALVSAQSSSPLCVLISVAQN